MSAGGPLRRPEKGEKDALKGDPVEVSKTNGETVLGEVKSVYTVQGHRNICVKTSGGELVTVGERVKVLDGVQAKEARQEAERGDND